MLQIDDAAPAIRLDRLNGTDDHADVALPDGPALLVFFETDCPTCRLTLPYLQRLSETLGPNADRIIGISQDPEPQTRELLEHLSISFPVALDRELTVSRQYDPIAVPTLFLLNPDGQIEQTLAGFDKTQLNEIASRLSETLGGQPVVLADAYDGVPDGKPGCTSRHLEPDADGDMAAPIDLHPDRGIRAARIPLGDATDLYDYCLEAGFADPLPVVPPTVERVDRMLAATDLAPDHVVALIPPNYGQATVEKIAANAVMAGCPPEMMRVLIPLVRAVCDENYNLHGIQATTHFAAPLIIINGPIRNELGFVSGGNVFSNVARANTSLGRALQLMLTHLGGGRPGEIDMSTLGSAGKFSQCIAENEEENPWEPLHVELGFKADQSTLSLFAAEPPRGVSEHNARTGKPILQAICRALATVWTTRMCVAMEAIVILCPEHVKTLHRDGFTKASIRGFLFDNTGVPVSAFEGDDGEGTKFAPYYDKINIDGVDCYRKFPMPEMIKILVAGGTAGKFSAVVGSWVTGPIGSQMVTYPIP
jgi:peroxiredoxin